MIALVLLASCRGTSEATPTPGLSRTQAYGTAIAISTQVSQDIATHTTPDASPTGSSQPTPTPGLTHTPSNATAIASTFTPSPTVAASACDRAEAGIPIDVTIPDDTEFAAGTAFVKTWRLVNTGSCSWTSGYSLVFFSGEKMGGPDVVPLNSTVTPGQVVDLSVNLTAPSNPGTYQGNWMLRNPSGVLFGIGPEANSFFWVKIVVPGGAGTPSITPSLTPNGTLTLTPTPNGTATLTPTPTPTTHATPVVIVNSSAAFPPDGYIDLDTGVTNGQSGNDVAYTSDQNGTHPLTPQNGAAFAIFGTQAPTFDNCRTANMGGGSLTVESLATGTYLCYRTDQGRYGWLRIDNFDSSSLILSFMLLTWQQ